MKNLQKNEGNCISRGRNIKRHLQELLTKDNHFELHHIKIKTTKTKGKHLPHFIHRE